MPFKSKAALAAERAAKANTDTPVFRNDPKTMKYDNWKYGDPVEADAPDEIRAQWWAEYKARQQAGNNN